MTQWFVVTFIVYYHIGLYGQELKDQCPMLESCLWQLYPYSLSYEYLNQVHVQRACQCVCSCSYKLQALLMSASRVLTHL